MTDVTVESRTAKIEGYAGKAASLTRTVFTKGFATADTVKSFFVSPKVKATAAVEKAKVTATTWWTTAGTKWEATKAKVKAMKPAAKEAPAA
jgi:hypothetical protein